MAYRPSGSVVVWTSHSALQFRVDGQELGARNLQDFQVHKFPGFRVWSRSRACARFPTITCLMLFESLRPRAALLRLPGFAKKVPTCQKTGRRTNPTNPNRPNNYVGRSRRASCMPRTLGLAGGRWHKARSLALQGLSEPVAGRHEFWMFWYPIARPNTRHRCRFPRREPEVDDESCPAMSEKHRGRGERLVHDRWLDRSGSCVFLGGPVQTDTRAALRVFLWGFRAWGFTSMRTTYGHGYVRLVSRGALLPILPCLCASGFRGIRAECLNMGENRLDRGFRE